MRAQAYANAIWQRWLKDYVPCLNKRKKWHTDLSRVLRTSDLVWNVDPSSPHGHYPLGRVTALHNGNDNVARSVCCGSRLLGGKNVAEQVQVGTIVA